MNHLDTKSMRTDATIEDEALLTCGYCGEINAITIDPTGGSQQVYVEDCQVCCRPNRVQVLVDPDTLTPTVTTDRES